MFLPFDTWIETGDGDPAAFALFSRHYSYQPRQRRMHFFRFVGPGERIVLLTPDCKALFVWRRFLDDSGERGVNCAVFRNEGGARSSALIVAAEAWAWGKWPGQRLYTFVNPHQVRHKRDPGRCFLKAGWRRCGVTSKRRHLILEKYPPPAQPAAASLPRASAGALLVVPRDAASERIRGILPFSSRSPRLAMAF